MGSDSINCVQFIELSNLTNARAPVLNPVDFLVFKDMNSKDAISDIVFLSKHLENQNINRLRGQVKKVIENEDYEWHIARIDNTGKIKLE